MKRIVCAVIAAGLLTVGPLAARANDEDGGRRGGRGEEMMKERLGLSDDQAAKLKAAWESGRKAEKELRKQSRETARKLEEEVRDLSSNKEISATLDQLDANRKAMAEERQKLEAAVASILKPVQRAKLRLMMRGRMKHRGGWGRGNEGPGGHEGCGGGRGGHDGRDGGQGNWDHGDR